MLTGFSLNSSFTGFFAAGANFQQANLNQPFRFGNSSTALIQSLLDAQNLSVPDASIQALVKKFGLTDLASGLAPGSGRVEYVDGYLANANVNSQQYLFFLPGFFDVGIAYAGEATKQPVTVGELLTLGSVPEMNVFAGPVLIITGCGSYVFSNSLVLC